MSESQERRTPRISDPASMKTEEEIEAQLASIKRMSKMVSVVLGVAMALMIAGFFLLRG